MGGLARYVAILRRPGFAAVLGSSVVGRLHESMISFAVIMLVTHQGSYAQAGVLMATYGAGGIVAGPVNSRLADRHGHVRVLMITAAAYAGAVMAMGEMRGDLVALGCAALLAGLSTPPLTPAVRAVLPRLVAAEHRLTAFALESTLQEVIFVVGPVLAGGVALVAGPRAALTAAAATTVLGVGAYCLALPPVERRRGRPDPTPPGIPSAPPVARDGGGTPTAVPLLSPTVVRLLVGGVGFLLVLSIAVVAVIAHVSGDRARGEAGILLALISTGSMLGGLVFGARVRPDSPLRSRYLALGGALAALGAVSVAPGAIGEWAWLLLGVAVLTFGATIAPVGAVLFARFNDAIGDARAAEAFGWMGAAMGVGGVLGDASGGWLVTVLPAWAVMAVGGAIAWATAAAVPRTLARAAPRRGRATELPVT